jgi:hypothetical protein
MRVAFVLLMLLPFARAMGQSVILALSGDAEGVPVLAAVRMDEADHLVDVRTFEFPLILGEPPNMVQIQPDGVVRISRKADTYRKPNDAFTWLTVETAPLTYEQLAGDFKLTPDLFHLSPLNTETLRGVQAEERRLVAGMCSAIPGLRPECLSAKRRIPAPWTMLRDLYRGWIHSFWRTASSDRPPIRSRKAMSPTRVLSSRIRSTRPMLTWRVGRGRLRVHSFSGGRDGGVGWRSRRSGGGVAEGVCGARGGGRDGGGDLRAPRGARGELVLLAQEARRCAARGKTSGERRAAQKAHKGGPGVAELVVRSEGQPDTRGIEIALSGGTVVRVGTGAGERELAMVLKALGAC